MDAEGVVRAQCEAWSSLDKAMTRCEFEIVNLAVAGDVVLTERIDQGPWGNR